MGTPESRVPVRLGGIEGAECSVGRSAVCNGERSCMRTGRWFCGSSVPECRTGHWAGPAGGADADLTRTCDQRDDWQQKTRTARRFLVRNDPPDRKQEHKMTLVDVWPILRLWEEDTDDTVTPLSSLEL